MATTRDLGGSHGNPPLLPEAYTGRVIGPAYNASKVWAVASCQMARETLVVQSSTLLIQGKHYVWDDTADPADDTGTETTAVIEIYGVASGAYVLVSSLVYDTRTGAEVALSTNASTPILAQTITGLLPSKKYLGTIGVRVSIWQEGTESNCGEVDCVVSAYVATDGSAVATVTLTATASFDKSRLVSALSTCAFAMAASTGGFTVSATRPSGVACAAAATWWVVSWRDIT